MKDHERMLWELFCATGEPTYYSLYVRSKKETPDQDK